MAFQSAPFNDNASIISSAISTKSKSSKRKSDAQSIVSLTPSAVYAYSRSVSPTSLLPPIPSSPATQPAKNTLSIRLAESAVFLRTNDATGRNRYNDSRPTFLRGIVQLELVKPTRISRIVLELGAKSVTVWPEGTHGRDLTEAHKVFSATETVFSAVAKRDRSASRDRPSGEWDSFVSFEDDTPPVSPSIGSGTGGWSSGWISPDVRSIQSQTSGTITPTTRRALSADSGRTRRALPDPPIQTPSGEPPPYAPDYTTEASPESPILTGTYSESRISFQSGVNVSRDRAPGRKSKSKPRRPRGDAPGAPLPAIPPVPPLSEASSSVSASSTRPLPTPPAELSYDSSQSERYPYSSATFTSTRSKLVPREPLVSTEFIASPLPSAARSQYEFDSSHIPPASSSSQADTQAEELNHPRETGFDPYQYARSHAQAHLQSSLPVGSSSRAHSQSEQPSSSRSHNNDDDDDTPRGRKRSRFSLASLGSRLVHAFSKSRSRSRSVSSKRPENKVRDSAEDAHTDRDNSPSRVSTRSGYSGISTASAVSGVTTVSTDSKKSNKRSLSLPWKKKRSSTVTTTSQMSGVSQGSPVSRATTDITKRKEGKG
ncbi:hypothetical protein D9757_000493 [Collybiopsis confluens]|uniref:Uncharacterized protein n=1 Tax=Collybiopsis confluens TaxID=2823264 RepID=A0A8H5MGE5_9AGAR|nr:hypothetical protein D9757_000493 [Collybiopsis confluens]